MQVRNQKFFRAVGGVELRHFNKHFVNNKRKWSPKGKHFGVSLPDTIKTAFWMENLSQKWTKSKPLCLKIRTLFFIFKKGRGDFLSLHPPCPLVACLWARLSMHQHLWISLNILKNASVNKLSWLCQGWEFTWSFSIFCRIWETKCLQF